MVPEYLRLKPSPVYINVNILIHCQETGSQFTEYMLGLYRGPSRGRTADPPQDATSQQANSLPGTYLPLGGQGH